MIQNFPLALEIRELTKQFDRRAVDGLDLGVRAANFKSCSSPIAPAKKPQRWRMVTRLPKLERELIARVTEMVIRIKRNRRMLRN